MKRFISILVVIIMAVMMTDCSHKAETDQRPASYTAEQSLTPTAIPELKPTVPASIAAPEIKKLAPVELLSKTYNPFFDIAFPSGYTVYSAEFDSADPDQNFTPTYTLYLTASGINADIASFLSELAGCDAETVSRNAETIVNEKYISIEGKIDDKKLVIWIKNTEKSHPSEQCNEVDGCRVALTMLLKDSDILNYSLLVTDNYNRSMLSNFVNQFSDSTIVTSEFSLMVNTQRPQFTALHVVHNISEAADLIDKMEKKLKYKWFDSLGNKLCLLYGRIETVYEFDLHNNQVFVSQLLGENNTPSSDYTPSISFESLGFSYEKNKNLCTYEDKEKGLHIYIYKPEWDGQSYDWNIEFCEIYNDYIFAVWYYEQKQELIIQADKDKSSAVYYYFISEKNYGEEWSTEDTTVKKQFSSMLGTQNEDYFSQTMTLFDKTIQDLFGMSWQELYALPIQ